MGYIKNTVDKIKLKYATESPYEIANALGIVVNRCDLGRIHGYYYKAYRIKQIFLNENLNRHDEQFVLAHELGHSILHPNANTPFLRANTFLSVNKMEIEANKFAVELLISDSDLTEFQDYSIEELSAILGYHSKLIELRLK